jgi:alpha-N-arabinofuranosidase
MGRKGYTRRAFLGSAVTGAVFALLRPSRFDRHRAALWGAPSAVDSRIEVLLSEPIARIAPEIYGHFIEHLGGVIYDGVWVGEDSRIPNIGGIRKALVEAMREIKPGVVRWPGGCFADAYDWRDGIGPREKRPRRTNFWVDNREWRDVGIVPQKYEPNHFGTHEFIRFCRLIGAQPYIAANVRTLPASVFHQWIEYCNSPAGSTTWADVRAAHGDREPFNVRYWGVGNESWGCGGNFTPEEYAAEFRRFTTWAVPDYGVGLRFIAAGPSGRDLEWTRRFFAKIAERRAFDRLWGWALHHYSSFSGGEAINYDTTGWYELLQSADRMESLIIAHWQVMGEMDRERRVRLVVDEWGAWYRMTTNIHPTHLFGQQSTIRDAVVAGLTLDTFNRHADKVGMANIAQLINCLHSLFLAHEEKFVRTPTYYVFAMYADHQEGQAVRTIFSAPRVSWTDRSNRPQFFWGLNGSASVKGKIVTLTVTNPHLSEAREAEVLVRGATIASARATILTARSMHECNTFEQPQLVVPREEEITVRTPVMVYAFPPASVVKLRLVLS